MTISISSNARLLLWASASFLLVVAALLTTALVYQARTGSPSQPVTPAEVDLAQPWWTLTGYALLVPIVLGAIASIGLTRSASRTRLTPVVTALWVVTVIACIAYSITWHVSMRFDEAAYSDSTAAVAAQWLVRGGVVPLAFVATGLLAWQLSARVTVTVCVVILIGWAVVTFLGIELPPALLAVVWIMLGVRILRMARRSPVAPAPVAP